MQMGLGACLVYFFNKRVTWMEGVIYVAHGSRRTSANAEFAVLVEKAMVQTAADVQTYAYLEHAEPTLPKAVDACVQRGAKCIKVIPVFLLPGIHANKDIPELMIESAKRHPGVSFCYTQPLGSSKKVNKILTDRLLQKGYSNAEENRVLLVSHGSREQAAAVALEKLRNQLSDELHQSVESACITTEPYYETIVQGILENSNVKKIFILPLLLFSGGFIVKMGKTLEPVRQSIQLCEPIGLSEELLPILQEQLSNAVKLV